MFNLELKGIRFFAASLLVCLLLSVGAMAQQDNKTILDEDGVAALLEELKEGLSEFINDEAKIEAIAEKWGAREDLSDKTRYGIIRLIIDDVESVVKDQKLRLKIWHKWNGVKEEPEIEPKPEPVRKPDNWIKFMQQGAYIAHFEITWDEPGRPGLSWREKGKSAGWLGVAYIPAAATNIRLKMQNDTGLVWQPQREIFDRVLQLADLNKCYRVTGTTLGSAYDNDCQ